jgi:hypothetical protein
VYTVGLPSLTFISALAATLVLSTSFDVILVTYKPSGRVLMLEMVTGAVRKSKSDIVLSTLVVSLCTECQDQIGRSTTGWTQARG